MTDSTGCGEERCEPDCESPRCPYRVAQRHRIDALTARLKRIPREAWLDALDYNDETVAFRAIATTLIQWEDRDRAQRAR